MFKDILSFNGRIRRTEYGITVIAINILAGILEFVVSGGADGIILLLYLIIMVMLAWIILAQTTKRCHDRNHSGWYQLIPFYTIYLLFAEGDQRRNEYGPNPKYVDYDKD